MLNSTIKKFAYYPLSPKMTTAWFHASSPPFNDNSPESILVIRLDGIGDLVLTTPFLRELRRNYPKSHITLIIRPETKNLFEFCPYCDEILTFGLRRPRHVFRYLLHIWAYLWAKKLRKKHFSWAIIPRWDEDRYHATILAYFSGAKRRIAFSETVNTVKAAYNEGFDMLLTDPVPCPKESHEVLMTLSLISYLGGNIESNTTEMWLTNEDRRFARTYLHHFSKKLYIAIAPGALDQNKLWPLERYYELSAWLVTTFNAAIVILGGNNEKWMGKKIAKCLPCDSVLDMTGKATLRQVGAVLGYCRLFIGNDTGVKHIAAAMNVKVIEISRFPKNGSCMHPQSPFRFRAWGVKNIVLQPEHAISPCNDCCLSKEAHCILMVDLLSVQNAVSKSINELKKSRMLSAL